MADKDVKHDHDEISTPSKESPVAGHGSDVEKTDYYHNDGIHIDKELDNKLFWVVNKRILPIMLGTYFCQSLDKGTIGFASIMGIREDANLVGQQFSWLGTILYMGYLAGEIPTNYLLQRFPVAKYLAVNIFCWGAVVACSAATKSFTGLMVVRFLLGLFEACVQPAFIIMTSMWYTKREQAVLTSLWFCMMGVQQMTGGLIAYGVSHYGGALMKSWQLLFLILGVLTCAWALFVGWHLPDSPIEAKCFNEDTKRLLVERVRANETGIKNTTFKKYQVYESFTDPVIWCYVMLQATSTLIIGGLGVFSNLIISGFGFTYLQTQLLNIAQGAIVIIVMISGATLAQTFKQTILIMHLWTIPPIIGTAIMFAIAPTANNRIGLLIAFYCTQFILAEGNLTFSLISRNIGGRTKKTTALATTFISWSAGNMAAPQIFQKTDEPRYKKGFTAHLCIYVIFNLTLVATRFLLVRRNNQKKAAALAHVGSTSEADTDGKITHAHAFDDLTDKENVDFRYVY